MKRHTLKRTLAGVLAVLCVAAYAPVELGSNGLFGSAAVLASAEGEKQQQSLVGTEIMIGGQFNFPNGTYYKDKNGSKGESDGKSYTLNATSSLSASSHFYFKVLTSSKRYEPCISTTI